MFLCGVWRVVFTCTVVAIIVVEPHFSLGVRAAIATVVTGTVIYDFADRRKRPL